MKIWLVENGDNGDYTNRVGAWVDRDDAFKAYADTVASQLSTTGIRAVAIDYSPNEDLRAEGRYGDWVSLESMDVSEMGNK